MNPLRLILTITLTCLLSFKVHTQTCVPNGLLLSEACDWNTLNSEWETAVDLSISINSTCTLDEVCYSRTGDGAYDCIDVTSLNLGDGTSYHLALPGAGIYQIWIATPSGTSTIEEISINCYDDVFDCDNPFATNYISNGSNPGEIACIYDTYICDCNSTSHTIGVMTYLGDGEVESATLGKTWNGNEVHFLCNVWGFDCGDTGINFDPYGVCSGNLPPNNGCSSPGCLPLTLSIHGAPCQVGPTGYQSVISFTFGVSDGCTVSELHYQVNSGAWSTIDFLPDGGYFNGDEFLLTNAVPNANYQCYFRTSSGAVSPYFNFQNGSMCSNPTDICDCDGNKWPESFTSYIGNGTANDGETAQDGYLINFDCPAWSFDCGDGSNTADPFGVCSGNLPPSGGCQTYEFGCTDDTACNFDPAALADDGSCDYSCQGCTDPSGCNYDPTATLDDGNCNYDCLGCLDPFACNYDNTASQDDGSCFYDCQGCTDDTACNFDPLALQEDGSCDYSCWGCTNNTACNYDPSATISDNTCDFSCQGCTDESACNFNAMATMNDGSCDYNCYGCTDVNACNFDPFALIDNGSCNYDCAGCTDPEACNYSPEATIDNGTCDYACFGCTNPEACNYNPLAITDDQSCYFAEPFLNCEGACLNDQDNDGVCDENEIAGCTYELACNYNPNVSEEDGSCDFESCQGCTYADASNFDPAASIDDGSCLYALDNCVEDVNADGMINVNDLLQLLEVYGEVCN